MFMTMTLITRTYESFSLFVILFKIQESVQTKLICPEKVSSIASSPDGAHCVVACGEKIYIWQVTKH